MMTPEQVLATYETMTALTTQMVAAARNGDWDQLQVLETHVSGQVVRLRAGGMEVVLDAAGRQRKIAMIKQMLDDDRIIRDLTLPWMARLSALISSSGTERRVVNAYGSV